MQFGLMTLFDFFPDRQNELAYYRDTLDLMVYAEKLGFDSVWVGEEHFYSLGICRARSSFSLRWREKLRGCVSALLLGCCPWKIRYARPRIMPCSTS